MNNTILGRAGEELAADWLESLGYKIIQRNVRYRSAELDLVSTLGPWLVFVEVKLRRGTTYGTPAEAITPYKRRRLILAASLFIAQKADQPNWPRLYRFDLVGITVTPEQIELDLLPNILTKEVGR